VLGSGPETAATAGGGVVGAPTGTPAAPPSGSGLGIFLLPIAVLILFTFMMGGTQRKEKKRMAALMANLKKHDKVLTIGGMIGTVVDIRDDEVVLKIDENANTRVRFTRNAIQQIVKASDGPAASSADNGHEPKIEVRAGKAERAAV